MTDTIYTIITHSYSFAAVIHLVQMPATLLLELACMLLFQFIICSIVIIFSVLLLVPSCLPEVTGDDCSECELEYHFLQAGGCQPCQCSNEGSVSLQCNDTGVCLCEVTCLLLHGSIKHHVMQTCRGKVMLEWSAMVVLSGTTAPSVAAVLATAHSGLLFAGRMKMSQ